MPRYALSSYRLTEGKYHSAFESDDLRTARRLEAWPSMLPEHWHLSISDRHQAWFSQTPLWWEHVEAWFGRSGAKIREVTWELSDYQPAELNPCAPEASPAAVYHRKIREEIPSPTDDSFVYFISGGGLIKIGVTINPKQRLSALQIGSPLPLCLLAVMPGGPSLEADLHKRFQGLRVHGEWFHPDSLLTDFIEQFGVIDDDDTVRALYSA